MSTLTLLACFAFAGLVGWALLVAVDAACDVIEGAGREVEKVHGVRSGTCPPARHLRAVPDHCTARKIARSCDARVRGAALGGENRPAPRVVGNDAA